MTNTATRTAAELPVRVAADELAPHIAAAMDALDSAARKTKLEPALLELIRVRASQLNGCAYCVDLHSRDALAGGEDQRRLFAVAVWRETSLFTSRERAALALAEAMTRLTEAPVADEPIASAREHFTEVELAELIWSIAVINAWNRVGATARPWRLA